MSNNKFEQTNLITSKLDQKNANENKLKVLENISVGSALVIPAYTLIVYVLVSMELYNPKLLGLGNYEKPTNHNHFTYCPKDRELFSKSKEQCEIPPLRKLSDLMFYNTGCVIAICSLISEVSHLVKKEVGDKQKSNLDTKDKIKELFESTERVGKKIQESIGLGFEPRTYDQWIADTDTKNKSSIFESISRVNDQF